MNDVAFSPVSDAVAFAMAVGPGEAEMAIDTAEGIASFYPNAALWIRDDRTSDGTWEKLSQWADDKPIHLTRNPMTQGVDGMTKTFCDLFHEIATSGTAPKMLVKVDPDAIFLRPGLVEVFRQKFAEHGPGMCGSYRIGPDGGRRRLHMHVRTFLYDMMPIGKGHRRSFRGKPVFYWKYLIRALRNGYSLGDHVLGGTYALDGRTLAALESSGFLSSIPSRHNNCVRTEDVMIALGTRAVGHQLIALNDYPEKIVAWLKAYPPLGITPEEAWDRKYMAVHPVKRKDEEIRRYFREKRLAG